MSQWIEVSIQTTHEAADLVAEIMRAAGANNGVVIEDPVLINTLRNSGTWELCDIPEQENTEVVTITAYYPEDEELQPRLTHIDEDLTNLETRIGKCRFGNTCFRTVSEQDWANEWKQYFHVTHIGRTLVIKPTWENIHLKLVNILLKSIQGWRLVQEHIIRPVCVWNVWKKFCVLIWKYLMLVLALEFWLLLLLNLVLKQLKRWILMLLRYE